MKIKWKYLIPAVLIPLLVGALSAFLTRGAMMSFDMVQKPPLSPPGWLFPVVWTVLYILMGVASYVIFTSAAPDEIKNGALAVYSLQLVFNFFWSIIFFGFEQYLFAFIWLLVLWILILVTIIRFYEISKVAAYLLIPYLVWVTFAAYLNLGIYLLN